MDIQHHLVKMFFSPVFSHYENQCAEFSESRYDLSCESHTSFLDICPNNLPSYFTDNCCSHAILFKILKKWKKLNIFHYMNNENMVRIYNRIALTCKENEIMKIADKQMELQKLILHNTDLERQTPYILSYLWILDVNL